MINHPNRSRRTNISIVWSNSGGEMDRATVQTWHGKDSEQHEREMTEAFINLLKTAPVDVGDIFTVEEG